MAQTYVNDPFPSMRAYKWSGFYAGFQGGYSVANMDASSGPYPGAMTQSYNLTSTGFLGGAHFGYNYQFGHYVAGAEVDIEGMNHSSSGAGTLGTARQTDIDRQTSVRARLGWAEGPWLLYGTAGWVYAGGDSQVGGAAFSNRYSGWTAGLGIERAITQAATLRLEYRYIDYGTSKFADIASNTQDKISVYDNGLRMGISFRF